MVLKVPFLLIRIIRKTSLFLWYHIFFIYYKIIRHSRTYSFQGKKYHYFYKPETWYNERTVEIPIVMEIVSQNEKKNILEIGNVLSNYCQIKHDVVDKYDVSENVINQDIAEFSSFKKYDLVVSISTLEHVGFDEFPKDPLKIVKTLENLFRLISEQGKIFFTWPLGYNKTMDSVLAENGSIFTNQFYLKRISFHEWKEIDRADLFHGPVKYNSPFFDGNYLGIAVYSPNSSSFWKNHE